MTRTTPIIKAPFLSVLSLPGFHGFFDIPIHAVEHADDSSKVCVLHARTAHDRCVLLQESAAVDLCSPVTIAEAGVPLLKSENIPVLQVESEAVMHGLHLRITVDLSSHASLWDVLKSRLHVARKSSEVQWRVLVPARILQS